MESCAQVRRDARKSRLCGWRSEGVGELGSEEEDLSQANPNTDEGHQNQETESGELLFCHADNRTALGPRSDQRLPGMRPESGQPEI